MRVSPSVLGRSKRADCSRFTETATRASRHLDDLAGADALLDGPQRLFRGEPLGRVGLVVRSVEEGKTSQWHLTASNQKPMRVPFSPTPIPALICCES